MYSLLVLQLLAFVVCYDTVVGAALPITKCKVGDKKCLKESAQAFLPTFALGMPEYKMHSLDPLTIDKVDADNPNLKLKLTNLKVSGLKDCVVKKLEHDADKSKIFLNLLCNVGIEGHYDMKGQIIILPMEGNGKIEADIKKILIKVEANLSEIEKGGTKYWNIKSWDHSFELKDKSMIQFENLFNGNKDLAKAAEDVMKESGNDVIQEVGPPVIKSIASKVVECAQRFFHAVPLNDLVLQ
ncbi:juvenile hormone-binding protein-like [Leptidea sinapis]|uniref:juvenile hormone-binding protein-like n=1 Tax=Leptidea sinapis TaxID=189913 RepID=UPI002127DC28|nr:juvenile hormone-binding protein-like [Leptidea sinapis]